jgi:putative MFS transporter
LRRLRAQMNYSTDVRSPAGELNPANLIGRIERLPQTPWHLRARMIVGTATFFDGFDLQVIAYALPVLVGTWKLKPDQIGFLISSGFIGQIVGALLFGWLAERIGRMPALAMSVGLFAVMSLVCAFAGDYRTLLACRLIQGVGIGGEVPVAAAYIGEMAKAKGRGRFVLLYELVFSVGLVCAALVGFWVIPRFGWQAMFAIGALPALLALGLRRLLPESARWLITKGRLADADAVIAQVERDAVQRGLSLPPVEVSAVPVAASAARETRWRELLQGIYLHRTLAVWALWFCSYFVTYGVTAWLPTLYRTQFHLSVPMALGYGLITQAVGLIGSTTAALSIDKTGRRGWFGFAFAVSTVPLLALWLSGAASAGMVLLCASLAYPFAGSTSLSCYLYTPEIYPTRLRALGCSTATVWLRIGSAIAPTAVGFVLARFGLPSVFLMFAAVALLGAIVGGFLLTETKGRVLEEISP